jgi:hypothetical protein
LHGAHRVFNRAIDIADRRQRAAQMAMAVGPIGRSFEQPFIGGGRLSVATAIAEQPGAEMGRLGMVRRQGKGAAAASTASFRRPLWNSVSAARQFNTAKVEPPLSQLLSNSRQASRSPALSAEENASISIKSGGASRPRLNFRAYPCMYR